MTELELFTTPEVAWLLGRSAASVRLLVSEGVLTPHDRVPNRRGKPMMRFEARKLATAIADTPGLSRRDGTLPAVNRHATFSAPDVSPQPGDQAQSDTG